MVRYIGMDVHREFAQLAVVEDGLVRDEGRIGVTPEALRAWAATLRGDDEVALEATGNSDAIANLLIPLVGRVVVSNPSKTRAIAEAKVKTDKVDARILAQLLAADFLPPVWLPDERTRSLRLQVARRAHLVRQRTRIKNQVHAILARDLAPAPPVSDLFGTTGLRCPRFSGQGSNRILAGKDGGNCRGAKVILRNSRSKPPGKWWKVPCLSPGSPVSSVLMTPRSGSG